MTETISGMFKITEGKFKKDAGNSLLRSLHGDHSGRFELHNIFIYLLYLSWFTILEIIMVIIKSRIDL